ETGSSNVFMVKDGQVFTPAANGTFLAGITRSRAITLLKEAGIAVVEATLGVEDFLSADEIFSTGNHSKVVPVIRIEDRDLQPGPVARKLRDLYWEWDHSKPTGREPASEPYISRMVDGVRPRQTAAAADCSAIFEGDHHHGV